MSESSSDRATLGSQDERNNRLFDDRDAFLRYCQDFVHYPRNLIGDYGRAKAIGACSRYLECHKSTLFPPPESKFFVEIKDFHAQNNGVGGTIKQGHRPETVPELESVLSWPTITPRWSAGTGTVSTVLSQDPKARFVILELATWLAQTLNITHEALFKLLAYHQVSPHYLKLLTSFSYQARASDPNIGSFSCKKFFKKHRGLQVDSLGRSGRQFQLSLQLTSFLEDRDKENQVVWSRYRAAVYHEFDVEEARSLWIITAPLRPTGCTQKTTNYLWRDSIVESTEGLKRFGDAVEPRDWFGASFDVFLAVGDWSGEAWGSYVACLAHKIMSISAKYVEEKIHTVKTEDLQEINWWLFELGESKLRLEGNKTALEALRNFYRDELIPEIRQLDSPKSNWILDCRDDIDDFADKLDLIIQNTSEMLQKTSQIYKQGQNREDYMQKLLQNQMNKQMKSLSETSQTEAYKMRIFQVMALIFLPVTVVSTVFSTDIVKYQDLPDGASSSFSATALWNWLLTAILLTGATLAVSQFLINKGPSMIDEYVSRAPETTRQSPTGSEKPVEAEPKFHQKGCKMA